MLLMFSFYFMAASPPPIQAADTTLIVGNASGLPGSPNNSVTVNLDNPDDKVGGVQLDICKLDNYLTCTNCEITERTNLFRCTFVEGPNDCDRILIFSVEPDTDIQEGDGPIAVLKYTISETAPVGECRNLDPEGAKVADEYNVSLGVESLPGQFCFASESPASIPTTSQWGIIIFMTIVLGIGVVTLVRKRIV